MRHFKSIIYLFILCTIITSISCKAQSYNDQINEYRKNYIKDLLIEKRQPLKPGEEKYIRFYPINESMKVNASFSITPGAHPFMIATHSGKQKPFIEYGIVQFKIHDTLLKLHVYQSVNLVQSSADNNELFIPFNDLTNYESTYAGGRYIDLKKSEIVDGQVTIDFNKCYNPYCAYSDGFSCPIPPDENYLHIRIEAGEKMFAGNEALH